MGDNLLKNPFLGDWRHGYYKTTQDNKVKTVEHPADWEFVVTPKEADQNNIPQSLHRERGFVIGAPYLAWEAGYVQRGVALAGKQRYVAKAVFKPDVNFMGDADLSAVTWRLRLVAGDEVVEQEWQVTQKGEYKQEETLLYVFEADAAVTVDFYFMARSVFAGNDCDLNVYELALESVPADYGGDTVPIIGTTTTDISTDDSVVNPAPFDLVEANHDSKPNAVGTPIGDKNLGAVVSTEEIDTIIWGLRALALSNESKTTAAVAGLNKLADVLARLKGDS